jgi:DNA (cytosine-5)-methyltransferase 1
MTGTAVRRLTPLECERLQAFPDGYTGITIRGKPAADGPRYKALGNAMCVAEVRWVLQRIELFEMEKSSW